MISMFLNKSCHVDPCSFFLQVSGGLLQHSAGNWNDGDHVCRDGWGHPCQHGVYGLQIRSYAQTGSGKLSCRWKQAMQRRRR